MGLSPCHAIFPWEVLSQDWCCPSDFRHFALPSTHHHHPEGLQSYGKSQVWLWTYKGHTSHDFMGCSVAFSSLAASPFLESARNHNSISQGLKETLHHKKHLVSRCTPCYFVLSRRCVLQQMEGLPPSYWHSEFLLKPQRLQSLWVLTGAGGLRRLQYSGHSMDDDISIEVPQKTSWVS